MADERVDQGRSEGDGAGARGVSLRAALVGIVVLVVVLLAVDNRHSVKVGYLLDEARIPLVWVIVLSLVVGAALGRAVTFVRARRRTRG